MRTRLTVTDFTRMHHGYVCLAGYDPDGRCIRPSRPRLHQSQLKMGGRWFVYPSAVVEVVLQRPIPEPPHTEDYAFLPGSIELVGRADPAAWRNLLEQTCCESVSAVFEQPITDDAGYYVHEGAGPRSLGTVRPRGIAGVVYGQGPEGTWDYRLNFYDYDGRFYRLKINDIAWHAYCDSLRGPDAQPRALAERLTKLLKQRLVFLRLGLTRGWSQNPGRCYLQITGVYTFPDYAEGRTLADLS